VEIFPQEKDYMEPLFATLVEYSSEELSHLNSPPSTALLTTIVLLTKQTETIAKVADMTNVSPLE